MAHKLGLLTESTWHPLTKIKIHTPGDAITWVVWEGSQEITRVLTRKAKKSAKGNQQLSKKLHSGQFYTQCVKGWSGVHAKLFSSIWRQTIYEIWFDACGFWWKENVNDCLWRKCCSRNNRTWRWSLHQSCYTNHQPWCEFNFVWVGVWAGLHVCVCVCFLCLFDHMFFFVLILAAYYFF